MTQSKKRVVCVDDTNVDNYVQRGKEYWAAVAAHDASMYDVYDIVSDKLVVVVAGGFFRRRFRDAEQLAPTAGGLTSDPAQRKCAPMFRGLLGYFPNALAYVSHVSHVGNEQHNKGEPMHWAYDKSTDEGDCIARHQARAGQLDTDGLRESGKVAWRALAQLERELLEADPSLQPGVNVRNFSRGGK